MKKIYNLFFLIFLGIIFFACGSVPSVSAYVIEDLHLNTIGSIIVGPGKTEVMLSPGDTYTMEIAASNASGLEKIMKFSVEDMGASSDPNLPAQFLGDRKGPYSLKDYVKPEADQIDLPTGQRVRMPVTITIPKDISPGGLYGAIMVAAENLPTAPGALPPNTASMGVKIVSRVGSLLFIRIKGDVLESGYLKNFTANENFYEAGPVSFKILYSNTGNVYLNPYGAIDVKDMFGRTVDQRNVEPWFVLPKADRTREIKWNSNFLIGKYTAVLTLHRGYLNNEDAVDTKTLTFWVLPWRLLSVGVMGLILIIWLFVWIFSHIQWKKSSPSKPTFPSGPGKDFSAPPVFPQDPRGAPPLSSPGLNKYRK